MIPFFIVVAAVVITVAVTTVAASVAATVILAFTVAVMVSSAVIVPPIGFVVPRIMPPVVAVRIISSSRVRVVARRTARVPVTRTIVRLVGVAVGRARAGRRGSTRRALTPVWGRATWESLKVGFGWKWQSGRHQTVLFVTCLPYTMSTGTVTVRPRFYPLASLSQIQSTPSAQDGVPHGIEEDLRAYGCRLIHQAGILLNQCVSFYP